MIRKIDTEGIITTVAGIGGAGFSGDGVSATLAQLAFPRNIAVDASGNIYIADMSNYRIRKVDIGGIITTIAGSGLSWIPPSEVASPVSFGNFNRVLDVAVDSDRNTYIAYRTQIDKLDSAGVLTTVAGTYRSGFSGDGGPATEAELAYAPAGIAIDSSGNLYISDSDNNRIRRVDISGNITTIAGTGESGFSGDGGPATEAKLNNPQKITFDVGGNLYIADSFNDRIRKIDAFGVITTVVGSGVHGFSGDGGLATEATLNTPKSVVFDAIGNLYIVDSFNIRIRKVAPDGIITTVAGRSNPIVGVYGFSGDGGPATEARLNSPADIAVDLRGNLYIVDTFNQRVRKVDSSGIITTVAGSGIPGFSGDGGSSLDARLTYPEGITLGTMGNIYIADSGNERIRRVTCRSLPPGSAGRPGSVRSTGKIPPQAKVVKPTRTSRTPSWWWHR